MNSIEYKYNKKSKSKLKLKQSIIFVLVIGIMGISAFTTFRKIGANTDTNANIDSISEEEKKALLNSDDPIIKSLVELSYENPKINDILNNIDKYPSSLLELASNNSEAVNFVANYPEYLSYTTDKPISVKNDYKPGQIPLFLQWYERWGYDKYADKFIAINGCGPTSLAMVAVGLTGNTTINPKVVANYAYENGFYEDGIGSSWSLISEGAKYFGLNAKELALDESVILSTLKNGNPIIVTVGPGIFTSKGHFLVLTGLTDDGKIKINDPNSKINSEK